MSEPQVTQTLPEWCTAVGLTIESIPLDQPAPWADGKYEQDGWTCMLTLERRTMVVPFWQGTGHREEKYSDRAYLLKHEYAEGWRLDPNRQAWLYRPKTPETAAVLACLLSDACGVEHGETLEDWCAMFDESTDSRAEAIYHQCQAIALQLRNLLGFHYEAAQEAAQDY